MATILQGNLKDNVDQLIELTSAIQRQVDITPKAPGASEVTEALKDMQEPLRRARIGANRVVRSGTRS